MGQYFFIVNMDKKQYLHPHRFGDMLKAVELASGTNTLRALAMLLTKSTGGGGGDFAEDPEGIIGSWAGDRIWIVGDYDSSKLFEKAEEEYEEMSPKVIPLLKKEDLFVEEGEEPTAIMHPDFVISMTRK